MTQFIHLVSKPTLMACAVLFALNGAQAAKVAPKLAPKTVAAKPAPKPDIEPVTPTPPADCIDLRGQTGATQRLDLIRGKSVLKRFCTPAAQVTVGAPEVANVVVPNASEIVIVARSVGSTNLIVSSRDGRATVFDLNVGIDTVPLRAQFDNLFPNEKAVTIGSSGHALILSGMVSDAAVASQMMALATAYHEGTAQAAAAGGSAPAGSLSPAGVGAPAAAAAPAAGAPAGPAVLNMLSVAAPQQVMLDVKIAEVSKSLVDQLGVSRSQGTTDGGWTYGIVSNLLTGSPSALNFVNSRGAQLIIDGQTRDGLIKILAEPNVMAVSGQEASFLAGGKIFIPVAQTGASGASTITLEEKEYGVAVKFTPTVLSGGRINLRVAPEVSELNRDGIGISVNGSATATAILPAFTTRRAMTTVQLQDGQSFAIGGLIRNNVTSNIKRFPFLGDLPWLGTLFRSSDFQNDRTELVFIVTPHLVKPLPDVPRLPTDNYITPTRTEFLLGGKQEGAAPAAAKGQP